MSIPRSRPLFPPLDSFYPVPCLYSILHTPYVYIWSCTDLVFSIMGSTLPYMQNQPKLIFFTDFDGTITVDDSECWRTSDRSNAHGNSQAMTSWSVARLDLQILSFWLTVVDR